MRVQWHRVTRTISGITGAIPTESASTSELLMWMMTSSHELVHNFFMYTVYVLFIILCDHINTNAVSGYRDSYYKDKTVSRPSYLYNGNPYSCKTGLYSDTAQITLLFNMLWCLYCFVVLKNLLLLNFHGIWFRSVLNSFFPWWRHQMETFSALLAICAGNSPVPGEFPTQRPVTQSFDVFFDLQTVE